VQGLIELAQLGDDLGSARRPARRRVRSRPLLDQRRKTPAHVLQERGETRRRLLGLLRAPRLHRALLLGERAAQELELPLLVAQLLERGLGLLRRRHHDRHRRAVDSGETHGSKLHG
jgi:hypothetical protein